MIQVMLKNKKNSLFVFRLVFGKSQRAVEHRENGKKTGCKIICGAPTTLAVKGLMMMMSSRLTSTMLKSQTEGGRRFEMLHRQPVDFNVIDGTAKTMLGGLSCRQDERVDETRTDAI